MKVTVVTPLFRLENLPILEANIATVLKDEDWAWLIVWDRASAPEWTENLELMRAMPRITIRDYHGGSRWASSVARNYAIEVEEGWILNLDDDCLLHKEMAEILKDLAKYPEVQVAAWQTMDEHGMIKNAPTPHIASPADTNAFGYQRDILENHAWVVEPDADVQLFNRIRADGVNVAYFNKPGVHWNVNRNDQAIARNAH